MQGALQVLFNLTAPYWMLGLLFSMFHICHTSPQNIFYPQSPEVTFKWNANTSKSEAKNKDK